MYVHIFTCSLVLFFFRMFGDFSKNCFNLGRIAYKRKKFPKRYMSFTLKFQGEKKQKNNALFNICFLGPSYAQGIVISKDSIVKESIIKFSEKKPHPTTHICPFFNHLLYHPTLFGFPITLSKYKVHL